MIVQKNGNICMVCEIIAQEKKSPQHDHECRTESFFSSFFSSFLQESMLRGRVMHPMLFLGLKEGACCCC
jgi:hypothetical protein